MSGVGVDLHRQELYYITSYALQYIIFIHIIVYRYCLTNLADFEQTQSCNVHKIFL